PAPWSCRSISAGARSKTRTPCAIAAPVSCSSTRRLHRLARHWRKPCPAGMENYETLLSRSEPVPDAMRTSSDLAGIFYTGGTTGRSKGVMLSHGNLMTSALGGLGEFDGSAADVAIYLHAAPIVDSANAGTMFAGLPGV